eukprot:jgi/Tetstr1/424427/TSEL_001448.t1
MAFKTKKQRAAERRERRQAAENATTNAGGAAAAATAMPISSPRAAENARRMIRASTELGNLRSQLKHLVKRAVDAEVAEQYWREVVDKQKAVEKELRSLLAEEAKQREEDAILRRKKDKAISRLRAKVRQLYNCPEPADDASGDEVSSKSDSGGEEAAAYRSVRERPSGLVYKLREARNYATIRKHIGRKVDMLENWLTEIVGDDDSWREMYTKTVVDSDSDSDSQAADDCDDAGTAKKQKQPPPPQEWEQIEKEEDLVGQPAGIVYDDESVVGVKGKEGLLVNSVENNLPCAFFLRDDCYEDVMKTLPTLPQQIDTLLAEGLMVDGKKHGVERFIERMVELAHEVLDYTYDCPAAVMYYIADILHNMLRVVPQIFLHTIQEHCTTEKLQEVGQWCYNNLKLVISEDIYLQTEKDVKKLNVSAESWPGATCRLLLDNFKNILEIAIDKHEEGEAKREGHVQAQASLQHKYPSHQFNQSRALKRAKME